MAVQVVGGVGVNMRRSHLLRRMKESRKAAWGLSRE
jgi:hypothetical protein